MILVKQYELSKEKEWNDFIERSKNGTFLFNRGFMDYHRERFIDHSLMFYRKGKLIALLPANVVADTIYSHQGLSYGGVVTDANMKAPLMLELFDIMKEYFTKKNITKLEYKVVPSIYHNQPSEEDLYALFRNGARLVRRDASTIINLARPFKMSSGRKDNIRKANRAKVLVLQTDDVASFHKMLADVLSLHHAAPVHSLDELILLKNNFPENIKLYGAYLDNKMLAGTLVFEMNDIIHTQYMASSEEGKLFGALDLIIKTLIESYKATHSILSFGPSTENSGLYLNEGLINQKEGFGGRCNVNDFYVMEVSND